MRSLLINICRVIPDSLYLRLVFYKNNRQVLDLKNPQTFNEKLQWLKLFDRRPEYTKLVDKYGVRKYIKEKVGERYLVPLIGVWPDTSKIDFDQLPEQFVLKCNHDSRSTLICKDKSKFDIQYAIKKLNHNLKRNLYWYGREWPYKNVQPLIIAEKYLEDENGTLNDYKVLCFNGKAKLIQVHCDRFTDYKQYYYDLDWNFIDIKYGFGSNVCKVEKGANEMIESPIEKPNFLKEMITLSEILAKNLIHVRVDWYFVNNQLYFGELTFYDSSGFVPFKKRDDEIFLGNMIDLGV